MRVTVPGESPVGRRLGAKVVRWRGSRGALNSLLLTLKMRRSFTSRLIDSPAGQLVFVRGIVAGRAGQAPHTSITANPRYVFRESGPLLSGAPRSSMLYVGRGKVIMQPLFIGGCAAERTALRQEPIRLYILSTWYEPPRTFLVYAVE